MTVIVSKEEMETSNLLDSVSVFLALLTVVLIFCTFLSNVHTLSYVYLLLDGIIKIGVVTALDCVLYFTKRKIVKFSKVVEIIT